MTTLADYYGSLGYPRSRWHVGAEHPALEEHAIRLLGSLPRARVLEVGYQAGGFAVPVILAMRDRPDFAYVGIDSLAYDTAVSGDLIARYLDGRGVRGSYRFAVGDAGEFLATRQPGEFDLILIDHDKRFYPRDLRAVLRRGLVSQEGAILLHDVLGKARRVWEDCTVLARVYGYAWSIVDEVPEGLAVVKPDRSDGRTRRVPPLDLWRVLGTIWARQARAAVERRWPNATQG